MRLRHYGFAFNEAIVVYIGMVLFKTCFLVQFLEVSLSSPGIENLQSRSGLQVSDILPVSSAKGGFCQTAEAVGNPGSVSNDWLPRLFELML